MRKPMTKAQQRLFQVNKAYDKAHLDVNNEYRRAYLAQCREMGLKVPTSVSGHMQMPLEFHAAMAAHQRACVGGIMLAQEARRSSARETRPTHRGRR
jgi:hypothetical protein